MSNSEDYLDGLLNSINKAKDEVDNLSQADQARQSQKLAQMNRVNPNEDFLDATGLSGYEAKPMRHDNLRRTFSESDFLADFESELLNDTADDFIRAFEEEIALEEAAFERGEDIQNASEVEFIQNLLSDDTDDQISDAQEEEPKVEEVIEDITEPEDTSDEELSQEEDTSSDSEDAGLDLDSILDTAEAAISAEDSEEAKAITEEATAEEIADEVDEAEEADEVPIAESTEVEEMDLDALDELLSASTSEESVEGDYVEPLLDEDADVDLEDLLSGDEDLGSISDLLTADSEGDELEEAREEFEEAANLSEADSISLDDFDKAEEEAKSNPIANIINKIKGIFSKKNDEETEEVDLDSKPDDDLSAENASILAELDAEDGAQATAADDKKAAKAAKKAEKAAERAAKKAEKAQAKASVEKKPSKIAEFFASDKSKKTPIFVLVLFIVLAVTLVVLVMVIGNAISKKQDIDKSKDAYGRGDYISAYAYVNGGDYNDKYDEYILSCRMLADLQNNQKQYDLFMSLEQYDQALDALIKGYARYNDNKEDAKKHGIETAYNTIGSQLAEQLDTQFSLSTEDAVRLHQIESRNKYSVEVYNILYELNMYDIEED